MAHVRKDTLTKPPEWWKHLKWQKRTTNKRERKASKYFICGILLDEPYLIRFKKRFNERIIEN